MKFHSYEAVWPNYHIPVSGTCSWAAFGPDFTLRLNKRNLLRHVYRAVYFFFLFLFFFFRRFIHALFVSLSLSPHAFPLDERRREGKNYRRYYHYTNKGTQTGAGTVFVLGNGRQIPGMGDKYKRLNGISIILAIISPSFRPLCPMLYLPYISNKCFPLL